ncbi:hypothetical protein V493_06354 [Pseudogymnoascus sp. VKM F-4281 (FW-2241)]|nr:hypothetical protein V493_06354 [Pseudogymnoascus sp. VKM F-4281 (FW-2241)]
MGAIFRSGAFLGILYLLATPLSAQYIPPITDLDLYSMLAPCAATAIRENISRFSSKSACPSGDRQLQSCICSQSELSSQVSRNVSGTVLSECGSSATDDTWSASKALELYCSPGATITFSTPTTNIVDAVITDVPQFSYLANCAQGAFKYGVFASVVSKCPKAPSLYAPCVCSKSNVVEMITKTLSSTVSKRCDHKEDASIAVEFYSQYCAMNQGTTSFALHLPPGNMSYYITGLPQYQALESCAQSGLDAVAFNTIIRDDCPNDPQGLASCICLKTGIYNEVYSGLTFRVSTGCTGTAAIISAVNVLDYYCSAAKNEVVATVTKTASHIYPTASEGSRTTPSGAQVTNDGNADGSPGGGEGGGLSKGGTIAVAVVVSVVGLIAIASTIWFFRRRRSKGQAAAAIKGGASEHLGQPELAGHMLPNGQSPQELANNQPPQELANSQSVLYNALYHSLEYHANANGNVVQRDAIVIRKLKSAVYTAMMITISVATY